MDTFYVHIKHHFKKALQEPNGEGKAAALAELKHLLQKDIWTYVDLKDLSTYKGIRSLISAKE